MPFYEHYPRTLNARSVREYAPPLPGVYGLTSASEWIYIGETDDIREALLQYLSQPDPDAKGGRPTGFVFELCDQSQRTARQNRLILEYEPTRNRRRSRY